MFELIGPEKGQVTALKPVRRDPSRTAVHVEGEHIANLPRTVVAELGLEVGMALDIRQMNGLRLSAEVDKAKLAAVKMLGRRALSSGELVDKLSRKGFPTEAGRVVAEELTKARVLDDAALGRFVIEQLLIKRSGPRMLRHKLIQRKLPAELVERLVSMAGGMRDQAQEAMELARRRLGSVAMRRLDPQVQKRRLWGLLARRGFDSDVIARVLDKLLREDEE